jgi:hypothetical protein
VPVLLRWQLLAFLYQAFMGSGQRNGVVLTGIKSQK